MTIHVRKCQGCKEERSEEEVLCGNCGWDLTQETLRLPGQIDPIQETSSVLSGGRFCINGHPLDDGDEMCFEPNCGATATEEKYGIEESLRSNKTVINDWIVIEKLESYSEAFDCFIVERHGHRALLTLYRQTHPDSSIYEIFKRLPKEYVSEFLDHGEWEVRHYDVTNLITKPNLLDLMSESIDLETIRQIVKSIGRILRILAENGLLHGNLRPENILIDHRDPLGLTLTGFQYCRFSAFELDTAPELISAWYVAPEVIGGGISAASDWWSLGMIVLQLLTKGQCFDGINEKAFRIHVVTRGLSIPKGMDFSLNLLLRGLLARDPDQRWQWEQVQKWLTGETVEAPSDNNFDEIQSGPTIELKEITYVCPKAYAIAAAEATNWEQAKDLLMRGVVATWLEDRKSDPKIIAGVRVIVSADFIPDDFRHAVALMWMNPDLPLIYKGEIVTSSWLLQNPVLGYEIITGALIGHLRLMNREPDLCELQERLERARENAKVRKIELDEESLRLLALVSSHQKLVQQWRDRRRLFPGSDHAGLNSLMDRQKISDVELLILLGAKLDQYQSAEQILNEANNLASQVELMSFDKTAAQQWFDLSRKELYRKIAERTANHSRCGNSRIDEWAKDFRIQKRISLPRALALLSTPQESWKEPDRLQYISTILEFFEKRTISLAQRGPLVRMVISKSNSRIDLASITGNKPKASSILEHLISRVDAPIRIDRIAFKNNHELEKSFRHLISHAKTFKRDTGIDSLYLGFPFIIIQDRNPNSAKKKPKIAPILLWPIKIDMETQDSVTVLFDHDRQEVRFNPALVGLLGVEETKLWLEAVNELLGRSSVQTLDVIDAFSSLTDPREHTLCMLPNSDYQINSSSTQLVCSAVFFHALFMGQALVEDLRQMQKETLTGTCLETVLRINKDSRITQSMSKILEKDRYFAIESDPSQEKAVLCARQVPGILVEGPPGTGKSQTIVNIISDCIGHNQTVLIVCQKSAALEVLAKRLEAERLQDRFFYITHVNKDRTTVIQKLRNQIDGIPISRRTFRAEKIKHERDEFADKIDKIEQEINKYHKTMHTIDEKIGLSYRELLTQLIDIEEQEITLIDVRNLRKILKKYTLNQLSVMEETCAPIAGIWLESSFEESPLVNLKIFPSDKALVEEFTTILLDYVDKEKIRDEDSLHSTKEFDVEDPTPHLEWIKSYDKIIKEVDWKKLSAWSNLFLKKEPLDGSEVIQQLEGFKRLLEALNSNKHDQYISPKLIDYHMLTIKKWLSLASKVTGLYPSCLMKHDLLKSQLEEQSLLLNAQELNDYDQNLSRKLTNISIKSIEGWLFLIDKIAVLNQQCFNQVDYFLERLYGLKQCLITLTSDYQDEAFSRKLVDIPMSTLESWLSLTKKVLSRKSKMSIINPFLPIQRYRIKRILRNLNEVPNLNVMSHLQNMIELEKQQRPIRVAVLQQLENVYQKDVPSKPLFPTELKIFIENMVKDLSYIIELRKIMCDLGKDLTYTGIKQFQSAAELEKQLSPIRNSVLNIFEQLYAETDQPENVCMEGLHNMITRMLVDLADIDNLREVLLGFKTSPDFDGIRKFKNAVELECEQRPVRGEISKLLKILYNDNEISKPVFLKDLLSVIERMKRDLLLAQKGIVALSGCPRKDDEIEFMLSEGLHAYLDLISRYDKAFARYQARKNCLDTLDKLSDFLCDEFTSICQYNIENNISNQALLYPIIKSLSSLSSFLEFRLQSANLPPEALKVFAVLRKKEKYLKECPVGKLEGVVRRLIAREARLSWKESFEQKFPTLLLSQKQLNRKIRNLEQSCSQIQDINKKYLAANIDIQKVAAIDEWETITRLRGPRACRLREIMERGLNMGLMELRPVWLMNPDTASQLLPFKEGMFDLIIFDEASQIPIENALPTLYRAKRVVISGDEKQMPPTTIFVKRFSDDEDYSSSEDEDLDEMCAEERDMLEDAWNRKEIKDCSDLLALGKTVLPKSMLQIHYRSKYRELIAFSNAAYYGNNLSVPVRHPESVIKSIRPIEVIRVNGIYVNQTNREEAEKVVDLLVERWSSPDRPSIGVVTFNVKQADLIEDILEERADNEPILRYALSQERERQQEGEDMSFFVKNVENVQGDERDVIIFSSTFGRDEKGIFRRQFGLLSQTGGEHRLNVAITRAREKIVIVTSLPTNEISEALSKRHEPKNSRDYLQAYFDYASKINDGTLDAAYSSLERVVTEPRIYQMTSSNAKDGFLRSVAAFIRSLGLLPSAINDNDAFGLDFVIEDPQKNQFGIGIECDVYNHPILETARAREVWRPNVLRLSIPHLHRVSIYEWYHRREEETERLKRAIEESLGVVLTEKSIEFDLEG